MWLHASAHSSHATEVVAVCNVNGPILELTCGMRRRKLANLHSYFIFSFRNERLCGSPHLMFIMTFKWYYISFNILVFVLIWTAVWLKWEKKRHLMATLCPLLCFFPCFLSGAASPQHDKHFLWSSCLVSTALVETDLSDLSPKEKKGNKKGKTHVQAGYAFPQVMSRTWGLVWSVHNVKTRPQTLIPNCLIL